jgi:hypothetical protein
MSGAAAAPDSFDSPLCATMPNSDSKSANAWSATGGEARIGRATACEPSALLPIRLGNAEPRRAEESPALGAVNENAKTNAIAIFCC